MTIPTMHDSYTISLKVDSRLVAGVRLFPILAVLIAALLCSGCLSLINSEEKESQPTAEELFERAETLFKNGEYFEAVNAYERLNSGHPEFEKAPIATMRIADALFKSKEYDKAAADYHRFVTLYPNSPNVPRAKYMEAMCFFMQRMSIDKDNTAIRASAAKFKAVMDEYKGTKWGDMAEKKYTECRKDLAAKELYKAQTYLSLKKYKAARITARRILEEYGKLGYDADAKEIIDDVKDR